MRAKDAHSERKDPSPNEGQVLLRHRMRAGYAAQTGLAALISPVRARGGPRTPPPLRERHLLNRCVRHRRGKQVGTRGAALW